MTMFPDDKHNFPSVHPVRFSGEGDRLPSLTGDTVTSVNPAQAYILSLNSPRSRQTMTSFLNIVARILGAGDLTGCNWAALRRHHVLALTEILCYNVMALS